MIPSDPVMLLSYVNMQLRDHYSSLEEMCGSLMIDREKLVEKLRGIDYEYDAEKNVFI